MGVRKLSVSLVGLLVMVAVPVFAAVFGAVGGHVRDPQDRPIEGAEVTLHAKSSAWNTKDDDRRQRRLPLRCCTPRGRFSHRHRSGIRPLYRWRHGHIRRGDTWVHGRDDDAVPVKDKHLLDNLSPGDQVTAKVVSGGGQFWLENIATINARRRRNDLRRLDYPMCDRKFGKASGRVDPL